MGVERVFGAHHPMIDGSASYMVPSALTDTGRLTMVTVHDRKRQVRSDLPCIASERNGLLAQISPTVHTDQRGLFQLEAL